jgi:hypothetical protein
MSVAAGIVVFLTIVLAFFASVVLVNALIKMGIVHDDLREHRGWTDTG